MIPFNSLFLYNTSTLRPSYSYRIHVIPYQLLAVRVTTGTSVEDGGRPCLAPQFNFNLDRATHGLTRIGKRGKLIARCMDRL